MNRWIMATVLVVGVLSIAVMANAQTSGSFRTHSSLNNGNWSIASSWDTYNGSAWVAASAAPTGSETIYIMRGDTVNVDGAVAITGTINDSCRVNIGTAGSLTIGNGGTYVCAKDSGRIPTATWATGSTCIVTGTLKGAPSNANQNFYNFTWDCANQNGNLNVAWTGDTIRGNVTCINSGASGRFYFTSSGAFAAPIVINGDVILKGGALSVNGSSSSGTVNPIVVNSYGNIKVTAGNFGCSRGSGPSVTWNVYGDTMAISGASLQNSASSPTVIQKFVFAKQGTQVLSIGSDVTYGSSTSPINMEVDSGTTLNIGNTVINSNNSGGFVLKAGATLMTSGGRVQTSSSSGASIGNAFATPLGFTGTGSLSIKGHSGTHPNSPNAAKSVNRYWTLTTSGSVTVDTLQFYYLSGDVQGTEANYVPMRYTGTGTSWAAGGTTNNVNTTLHFATAISPTILSADWTVGETSLTPVEQTTNQVPLTFYVKQNYPNPFNPTTNITYGLPKNSYVSVKVYNILGQEVAILFVGEQAAGVHTVNFNASSLASGIYLYRIQAGISVDTKRMVLIK
jgi:hypothetical protein